MRKFFRFGIMAILAFAASFSRAGYDDAATEGYVQFCITNSFGATNFSIAVQKVYDASIKADAQRIASIDGNFYLDYSGRVWRVDHVWDDAWHFTDGDYFRSYVGYAVNYERAYTCPSNSNVITKESYNDYYIYRRGGYGGGGYVVYKVNDHQYGNMIQFSHYETNLVGRCVSKADINADESDPNFVDWTNRIVGVTYVSKAGDTITGELKLKGNLTIDGTDSGIGVFDKFDSIRAYGVTGTSGGTATYGYKTLYEWAVNRINSPDILVQGLKNYAPDFVVGNKTNDIATVRQVTNIADSVVREIAPTLGTTKLMDAFGDKWQDVNGNVYLVSTPTYWRIYYDGLFYNLRTNSVSGGVVTWRNMSTEFPQLVYNNGTWTAYNPSGVNIGTITEKDGTETNLTASSWRAVKGPYCETNIVDHVMYENSSAIGFTAVVSNIVTKNVGGEWTTGRRTPDTYLPSCAITNTAVRWNSSASHWEVYLEGINDGTSVDGWYTGYVYDLESVNPFETVNTDYNSLTVTVGKVNFSSDVGRCVYATRAIATHNALGLAYEKDIPSAISNNVPTWALSETPPESMTDNAVVLTNNALKTKSGTAITATAVGAATSTELATVSANVNSALLYSSGIYSYMTGNTNAWFEGTNYNTNASTSSNKVHYAHESWEDVQYTPCSLQLYEIRDGQRSVVWDQRDWTVYYWQFKSAQLSNNLATATANLATEVNSNTMKRGWAKYTAVKGLDNPATNTLWVDTENVSLMAGKNWEKLVTVGGAGYYTLTGNGVEISPESATNTFLTIKDFEGNAVLTFRKTSSYLVYCECGTDITNSYHDAQGRVVFQLTTDVCPTAEFSTVLDTSEFVAQGDADCPVDYEWTGSAGNWECHFLLKSSVNSNACFARFKVLREGENVIEYSQPIKINGGISFEQNGTTYKIRPSVSGSTVTWSVVQ